MRKLILSPKIALLALLLTAAANSQSPTAPALPNPTAPPATSKQLLAFSATGVQIYACKSTPAGPAWTFVAPQATLLSINTARRTGSHFAGPTWRLNDGSTIRGTVIATAPSPAEDSIPWLLLKPIAPGTGQFADVQYIRRTDTVGGKAPTTGCTAAHLNATTRVDYKAIYTFFSIAM